MKSAVLKNGKIELIEVEKPNLTGKKGAVIKVIGCGLCGSDIVKINNAKDKAGVSLGHEVVGQIMEVNTDCEFKAGDIIALGHHYPCFKCKYCLNGNYSMCKTFKASNIHPGGFSEYIFADENHLKNTVFKKPENLTEEEFSFLEPLSCCIRAIRRAGLELEKDNSRFSALVVGLGSIGILMFQALKVFGANAYGFDINEKRQAGIEFNPNIKYDIVFMTSGSFRAVEDVARYIDEGGKIIVFSSVANNTGYLNNEIYYKELSVIGSYSPSPFDLKLSCRFLTEELVKVKGFSTQYSLKELGRAIADTKSGKILKGYVKL